jgi:putative hemolysin
MPINGEVDEDVDRRMVSRKLSPILKGYLRAGAVICGAPAYDAEFGTADVLALLEMEKMAARYKQHYAAGAEARIG